MDAASGSFSQLQALRLRMMMTQQEVADEVARLAWRLHGTHVGINADMVSKWERGKKKPSAFYTKLLCTLFQASPANLGIDKRGPILLPDVVGQVESHPSDPFVETAQALRDLVRIGAHADLLSPELVKIWKGEMVKRRELLKAMGLAPVLATLGAREAWSIDEPPLAVTQPDGLALDGVLQGLEDLYYRSDPARIIYPTRALAATAESLARRASSRHDRQQYLNSLARASLLSARMLLFDQHRPMGARAELDLAREAALEVGDPLLSAVIFGHTAFLPAAIGNHVAAAHWIAAARDSAGRQPLGLVHAWLEAVEGEVLTRAGSVRGALSALDRSESGLAKCHSNEAPGWFSFFDNARLRGFQGFTLRKAGMPEMAEAALREALVGVRSVKQHAVLELDLAMTLMQKGDIDDACGLASGAADDLRRAGYATGLDRLREFCGRIAGLKHPAVALLNDRVVELTAAELS